MSDLQKSHVIQDGPVDAEMDGLDGNADKEFFECEGVGQLRGCSNHLSTLRQDANTVLPVDAVTLPPALRKQLSELGLDPDVEIFLKQKMLKQQAREEKAQKALKRGLLASMALIKNLTWLPFKPM